MIIAADRNIPFIAKCCAPLGEVRLFSSADADELRRALVDADVLLCRSTIAVNEALLGSTRVRFVATATAGFDHVDTAWLASRGIAFASAAGSNALSVAEYVFTALLRLACRDGWNLAEKSIGIIGVGHVGSWVELIAHRIGMRIVCCDPPLRDKTGDDKYRPMDDALACDIVTLHVPLTRAGLYPTFFMVDDAALARLTPGAVLVNTARGDVPDLDAVRRAKDAGRISALVLDVYPDEPAVDPAHIALADIATPHIAGHSHDGKLLGTQMVYEALCAHLNVEPVWNYLDELPDAGVLGCVSPCNESDMREVEMLVRQVYDIRVDDAFMRGIAALPVGERTREFARYRNNYPIRREFAAYSIDREPCSPAAAAIVQALGIM